MMVPPVMAIMTIMAIADVLRDGIGLFAQSPQGRLDQIRACDVKSADEPVDVPAERPPVGWHVGRIN